MSEQKASYHTSNTCACFNCEGTMTRTDHPEPGWYCKVCDTFLPDDQAKPRPGPAPTPVYIRVEIGGAGKWRSAALLKIGAGRVRVDDPDGPLWVQSEQIHPDDRRKIASGEITEG